MLRCIYSVVSIEPFVVEDVIFSGGSSLVLRAGARKIAGQVLKRSASQGVAMASRGFRSFSAFKRAMGPASPGQAWHHIVEQTTGNLSKFGNEAIHNTGNLIKLPHGAGSIHAQLSGYYSSIRSFTGGQTVRQWLSTQSYQQQYDFGIKMLKQFGGTK